MADSVEMSEEPCLLQRDLTCPVCLAVFRDPVLLPCSHSFCRECVRQITGPSCPVCRQAFGEEAAISNRALGEACESFLKQGPGRTGTGTGTGSEVTCNLHLRPLDLFCEKDEEPVCVDCVTQHSGHSLLPLGGGVLRCKKELSFKLQIFEKKRESYKKKSLKFSGAVDHIRSQAKQAEQQIKDEFERLHQILHTDESLRLQSLANEEEKKIAALNQLIHTTNEDVVSLDQMIDSIKLEMANTDINILRNFQSLKRKAQWTRKEPGFTNNSVLNVGKHVGALGFNIWKKMQSHVIYYPVVLDPNSSSPWLSVSSDLTSVKQSLERLTTPDTPERFDPCAFILGAEGYTSGRHKWDVIVCDHPHWMLGVCKESVIRKKKFSVSPNRGVWAISLSEGVYKALQPERQELQFQQRPERIRVKLDVDKGQLSFYDGDTTAHLVTFTANFDQRIFPIFGPGLHSTPMSVAPGKMVLHTS